MIEGLRVLPFFQDAVRRNRAEQETFLDCKRCMENNPEFLRRDMACGYLPGASKRVQFDGVEGELTTCVGYTTKLNEVIEVYEARLWWDKGQLSDLFDGEPLSKSLKDGITILESSANAAHAHAMKSKPGGPK